MDIRIVGESIFNIDSDCIIYFVDNAFANDDSMELISKSGDRILDVFSKISSIPTYDFKIVPAFNIKSKYIALTVLPNKIEDDEVEKRLFETFNKIFLEFQERDFNKISLDVKRLEKNYSLRHGEIFKKFLRNRNNTEDIVVFLCK